MPQEQSEHVVPAVFAILCKTDDPQTMPWLCCVSTEHKIGGPALFNSERIAATFIAETNTKDAQTVKLSRESFYKLAGDALKDGFNVFAINPSKAGRFVIWKLSQLLDSLPRNDPCPCGSGEKTKHCCAAPPEHRYTPRLWPVVHIRTTVEAQGKNEATTERFEEV